MSIKINQRTDLSYLFSSMNSFTGSSSGVNGLTGLLSDYSTIKSGSYGKLMKAYYGGNANSTTSALAASKTSANSATASKDDTKTISTLRTNASALKTAADDLLKTGKDSVFAQKDVEKTAEDGTVTTEKGYDTNAIYKSVSKFVDSYNASIKSASSSNNQSIVSTAKNMVNATAANSKTLAKVGITINDDNSLSIDEKTFKSADMKTVQNLFGTQGSYGYGMSARASYVDMYAKNDASKVSGLYSQGGVYSSSLLGSGYNFYGSI